MRVTIMGHAGLYLEAGEQRLLLDPVLHTTALGSGAFGHTYPRDLRLEHMPRPTALVITHAHVDHLDPVSLEKLPRDLPVVAPADPHTIDELKALGFTRLHTLDAWQTHTLADMRITATPTDSGVDEVGYLFESPAARFWHMSDAEAEPAVGERISRDYGRCDVVGTKYQPTTRVMARMFRSLGPAFDKDEVIEWLEATALTDPKLVFPYASGLSFVGRFEWLNRYLFPYPAEEIVELMKARLGTRGTADTVYPGDVIAIDERGPRIERQASPFVLHVEAEPPVAWEPIDTSHFRGLSNDEERSELADRLDGLMRGSFAVWLRDELRAPGSVGHALFELRAAYQLSVHMGDGERLHWGLNFGARPLEMVNDRLARPNFEVHMCGRSLLEVLRGEAGSELLYACGDALIFEKILQVRDGKFWAPAEAGMALYGRIADPLTYYLRWRAPKDGVLARGSM